MKPITITIIVVLVIALIGVLRWYSIPGVIRNDLALQGLSNRYYDIQVNSTDSIIHEGYLYRGFLAPVQTLPLETITKLLESYERKANQLPNGHTIYLVNSSGELIKKITTANST